MYTSIAHVTRIDDQDVGNPIVVVVVARIEDRELAKRLEPPPLRQREQHVFEPAFNALMI